MDKFARTRTAIQAYDAERPRIDALYAAADSPQSLRKARNADDVFVEMVQEAFYEDTKDINTRKHASLVHPDDLWLRALVSKGG